MSSLFHSKKPVAKPKDASWAVLEPANLPPVAFADRALGSIIPHSAVYQPTSSHFLPIKQATLKEIFSRNDSEPYRTEDSGAKTFIDSQDTAELKGKLSKILDLRTHKTATDSLTIETQTVCTRTFLNPPVVFEELKKDNDTLAALNKILDDEGEANMIIGLKTCIDAKLNYTLQDDKGTNITATIPINEILVALGTPPVPIDLTLSAEANLQKIRDYMTEFEAKGERVFALQFQRIMRAGNWRKKKTIELQGLQFFEQGLHGLDDDDEDLDDDDLVLCPPSTLDSGFVSL